MSSKWPEFTIDELKAPIKGAIAMGPFGSRIKVDNFVQSGVPVLKGGNLHGTYIDDSKCDFLTEEKANELSSSAAYKGDIVITHRGTIGQISIIPENAKYLKYIVSQSQLKISLDKSKVNPYYVNYFLRSRSGQHQLLSFASQVGVPAIAQASTSIKKIKVPCPPLQVQKCIVHIIKTIDNKILNNTQTNQTLEAMAQALFKSWFVDFDPVKTKMRGEKPVGDAHGSANVAGGRMPEATMDDATAALFPDTLVESELGLIPEGWEVSCMGNHFNITMGQSPKGETYNENGEGIPFFQGRRDFRFRYPNIRVYTTDPKRFAKAGDTLISVRAPVGDKNMANIECCIGRGVAAIKHNSGSRSFTYSFVSHIEKTLQDNGSSGTVFSSINQNELKKISFVVPPQEIIDAFHLLIDPIDQKVEILSKEIDNLAKLRDTLLPKLLSGEISLDSLTEEA